MREKRPLQLTFEFETTLAPGVRALYASGADTAAGFATRPTAPAVVTRVDAGSWADVQGLAVGDELLEVGGASVAEMAPEAIFDSLRRRPMRSAARRVQGRRVRMHHISRGLHRSLKRRVVERPWRRTWICRNHNVPGPRSRSSGSGRARSASSHHGGGTDARPHPRLEAPFRKMCVLVRAGCCLDELRVNVLGSPATFAILRPIAIFPTLVDVAGYWNSTRSGPPEPFGVQERALLRNGCSA